MKTSPSNLLFILIGVIFLSIGLWRTVPLEFNAKFWKGSGPMIAAFILTLSVALAVGGKAFAIEGIDTTVSITGRYLLTLLLLFPIMAFSIPILHHFEATIVENLKGPFGYAWTFLCSMLSPSSTAFGPLIGRLYEAYPSLRPMLMYFLSIVPQISLSIFVFRSMGLNQQLGFDMYKVSFGIAVWLLPFFWVYDKFFYRLP